MVDFRFQRAVGFFVLLPEEIDFVGALRKGLHAGQRLEHETYVLSKPVARMGKRRAILSGTQEWKGEYPAPDDLAFPIAGGCRERQI